MLRYQRIALSALLFAPGLGFGQDSKDHAKPVETVIKLTVAAAGESVPALKYQLLPDLREMNSGNPIQAYLACFSEQNLFFYSKEAADERARLDQMPFKDLPDNLADYGGLALKRADEAARLDRTDWQILLKLRRDGVMLLLPEVQQMRTLAWAMKVRMRCQVKAGRFDDAVGSAKTLFAMGRHMDEHPTLVAGLVGIAMVNFTVPVLEEMAQEPGSPNLFWAYANLPRPMVTFRKGWQGERLSWVHEFEKQLPADRPMSEGEISAVIGKTRRLVKEVFSGQGIKFDFVDPALLIGKRTKNEAFMTAARAKLQREGIKEAVLSKMPAEQIALLDGLRRVEAVRDESLKWFNMPYYQSVPGLTEVETRARAQAKDENLPELHLAMGIPMFTLRRLAASRAALDARLALLAHVEALRLYAAAHGGQWPTQLSDTHLPLPPDPYTGEPIQYRVAGNIAHLRCATPTEQASLTTYVRYEVVLRR
jgi:hypothetical protein